MRRSGLYPAEERDGGLLYRIGDCEFALYESAGTPDGSFTQMAFTVSDVAAEAAKLRDRGVVLESYDVSDFKTHDGIAEIVGITRARATVSAPVGSATAKARCSAWASRLAGAS